MLNKLLNKEISIDLLTDTDIELIVDDICALTKYKKYFVIHNILMSNRIDTFTFEGNALKIASHPKINCMSVNCVSDMKIFSDKYNITFDTDVYERILVSDFYVNNINVFDISLDDISLDYVYYTIKPLIEYIKSEQTEYLIYCNLLGIKPNLGIQSFI